MKSYAPTYVSCRKKKDFEAVSSRLSSLGFPIESKWRKKSEVTLEQEANLRMKELVASQVFIYVVDPGSGAHHSESLVEFGAALAWNKDIYVVYEAGGSPISFFHIPGIVICQSQVELFEHMGERYE